MSSRKITCKFCEEPRPQIIVSTVDGKSVATNLDGSTHHHVKTAGTWETIKKDAEKQDLRDRIEKNQATIQDSFERKMAKYDLIIDALTYHADSNNKVAKSNETLTDAIDRLANAILARVEQQSR